MTSNTTRLIIFTRAPVTGKVKTRLIPALGELATTELHRRMITHTVQTCIASQLADVELHCAPDSSDKFFQQLSRQYDIELVNQHGIDLGERMFNAISTSLQEVDRCLLIGTDCPWIDVGYLRQAIKSLDNNNDLVIGPAEDGGYVLIGARFCDKILFQDVDWGTGKVLQQTLDRCNQLGLGYQLLDTLWDIDRIDDFQRLQMSPEMAHLCSTF